MYDYLGNLKTIEIFYSDEDPPKFEKYKNILNLDNKPFLAFARQDFSKFSNFRSFFKSFGSLYLKSFLEYLFDAIGIMPKEDIAMETFHDAYYYGGHENIPELLKNFHSYKEDLIWEIREINDSNSFERIYLGLMDNINLFLKDLKPIEIDKMKELHDFLYQKPEKFFDYNEVLFCEMSTPPYKYRTSLIEELQNELNEYIKILNGTSSNHVLWSKGRLNSYLNNLNLEIDFDEELVSSLKILNPKINTLLILELLYYYMNQRDVGQCAFCGKSIVVLPRQKRFYDEGSPIYCYEIGSSCQEQAKDKRGNERKKSKRLKNKVKMSKNIT